MQNYRPQNAQGAGYAPQNVQGAGYAPQNVEMNPVRAHGVQHKHKNVLVIGASDISGRHIIDQLIYDGYNVTALTNADLTQDGLRVIKGDAEVPADLERAAEGMDVIVSAYEGQSSAITENLIAAAQKHSVKRVITVEELAVISGDDKYTLQSEGHLQNSEKWRASGLQWTAVCPPAVEDRARTNQYDVNVERPSESRTVAAGDVAHFVSNELVNEDYLQKRVAVQACLWNDVFDLELYFWVTSFTCIYLYM